MATKFAFLFWFKRFSFIIILITFQAVISEFSRCFKCILNIFENQQKTKKNHKFYFFIFSKNFLHNHYFKLFLDWFTRNCDFNCGVWTCWMKIVVAILYDKPLYKYHAVLWYANRMKQIQYERNGSSCGLNFWKEFHIYMHAVCNMGDNE